MADEQDQLSFLIEEHEQEHRVLVKVCGEVDLLTAPALSEVLSATNSEVVVDLAQVTFMDAQGLGVLVEACTRAEGHGDRLVVVNASPMARRLFEVTGLEHLLSGSEAL